jgi:hypothetical protein
VGKRFAGHAEDDIADFEDAIRGRTLVDPGDGDLAGFGCFQFVAEHPAAGSGGTECPIVIRTFRDGPAHGEIRHRHLVLGACARQLRGKEDEQGGRPAADVDRGGMGSMGHVGRLAGVV